MHKFIKALIVMISLALAGCSMSACTTITTNGTQPSVENEIAAPSQTVSSSTSPTGISKATPSVTQTPSALPPTSTIPIPTVTQTATPSPEPSSTSTPIPMVEGPITYGYSVQSRPLQAFRIGTGPIARALVGGIHGGYEANTTRLVEEFFTYLATSTDLVPPQITLYLVPQVNPDGAAAGTDRTQGRLNANSVDLNRNWDYEWQSVATHGTQPVSGGSAPFSEPETSALRDFILNQHIQAAIFYHSAMSEVYPGAGRNTSKTEELAILMAEYTGYRYAPECIPGQITTGDAINWLTTQGITAVEVELSTHTELDWEQNLAALLAFLNWDLDGNK
jgi:predicted deacylase